MSPATGVTRRRGRRLTWLPVVVIVLLVVEIWLLVELGHAIGTGWVLVLLLVETTFGLLVLRRAGRRALEALRATAGVPLGAPVPGRPAGVVGDSLLFGAGGALLVLPGMLSDVFGLLCLFPPSRHALRRA
ncbi:MAG: FxsA family protein, partial [Janthinobacterium lividum]